MQDDNMVLTFFGLLENKSTIGHIVTKRYKNPIFTGIGSIILATKTFFHNYSVSVACMCVCFFSNVNFSGCPAEEHFSIYRLPSTQMQWSEWPEI
jgi:hypothetical protein